MKTCLQSRSWRFSRRALLRGMGVGGALLPLLEPELASAACLGTGPKRLIFVNWPNGVTAWPARAETADAIRLPEFMKDLEPFKADCLFVKGLRFRAVQESPNPQVNPDGHQSHAGLLTGKKAFKLVDKHSIADGLSVDQWVGNGLQRNGYTGLVSLNLGIMHTYASTQWRASQQPVLPDNDPYHVFDTLFAGKTMASGPAPEVERLRETRKSILDVVGKELERFGARVGTADRTRIEAHLESIRDLEKRLIAPANGAAATCSVPTVGSKLDIKNGANFPALIKLQMDMCVAALAADISRVAVIQIGNDSNHHVSAPWLGYSDAHHDIAHNGPTSKKARLDQWYHEMYAYLLGKLKADKEGDKTMLDSTATVAVNNMEHGIHAINRVPWIIAGSCHGQFRTGRAVEFDQVPHNGVLIALANAMGVPTTTFGNEEYGGELRGLRGG